MAVFLSHGEKGKVRMKFGLMDIQHHILAHCSGRKRLSLSGKPKIFIIQATQFSSVELQIISPTCISGVMKVKASINDDKVKVYRCIYLGSSIKIASLRLKFNFELTDPLRTERNTKPSYFINKIGDSKTIRFRSDQLEQHT